MGHCHAKEGHFSGIASDTTYYFFFGFLFLNFFWIVSSSHSLTFKHDMSQYYST